MEGKNENRGIGEFLAIPVVSGLHGQDAATPFRSHHCHNHRHRQPSQPANQPAAELCGSMQINLNVNVGKILKTTRAEFHLKTGGKRGRQWKFVEKLCTKYKGWGVG